ncbi:hypothetical protein NUU61_005142 [Penicillium alfredii]|uniref:Fork-head domain-containing protein n=1 Tax=Penicillium alfredii TaxID=1506179 RepID=A0A9W9F8Z7_9EURO|nr:uncharacterized protein NUU61_005142 [Penicillium alfredii]KAJ5095786.1 hypothetical protein NUU61_005142 [Penicillium alfredii]
MPTGQQEHQYHLSAKTGSSSPANGLIQMDAPQPYNPCYYSLDTWARSRSNLVPETIMPPQEYTDPWGMGSGSYLLSPTHSTKRMDHQTQSQYSYYPASPSKVTSASIMGPSPNMGQSSPEVQQHRDQDESMEWKSNCITSPSFDQQNGYSYSTPLGPSGNPISAMRAPPLSPPFSISSHSPSLSRDSTSPLNTLPTALTTSPPTSIAGNSEEDFGADPPYSQLIFEALRHTPGQKLPLQGIYSWFEKNTTKAKDQNSKGWQNSIRHNLSMNAGFEAIKEEAAPGKKAVNFWRLTKEASRRGIQSTTRYRKQANHRKAISPGPPVPQRQRSGSKGGRASKSAAQMRHHVQDKRKEQYRSRPPMHQSPRYYSPLPAPSSPSSPLPHQQQINPSLDPSAVPMPHYHAPHSLAPAPNGLVQVYDHSTLIGCTSPPPGDNQVFCDPVDPGTNYAAFDRAHLGWYGLPSGFNNGPMIGSERPADLHLGV